MNSMRSCRPVSQACLGLARALLPTPLEVHACKWPRVVLARLYAVLEHSAQELQGSGVGSWVLSCRLSVIAVCRHVAAQQWQVVCGHLVLMLMHALLHRKGWLAAAHLSAAAMQGGHHMCRGLHSAALGGQPHWTAWPHSLWCVGCCVCTPMYRLMALPSLVGPTLVLLQ